MAAVSTRLHVYYSVYCVPVSRANRICAKYEVIHESIPSKAIQHINYSPTNFTMTKITRECYSTLSDFCKAYTDSLT